MADILIDTFDLNRSVEAVEEAMARYSTGIETGRLLRATRPNPGAKFTLIDSTPTDGKVEVDICKLEVDICKLEPFGWRIRVITVKAPSVRQVDGPTALDHARGIASAIKGMDWMPVKPARGALRYDWYEWIYKMEKRKRQPSWRDVIDAMGLDEGHNQALRTGYSRHKVKYHPSEQVDEDL